MEFLNEYFGNPKAIILFGSFRLGEDLSTSDIDIAIEREGIDEYKTMSLRLLLQNSQEFSPEMNAAGR